MPSDASSAVLAPALRDGGASSHSPSGGPVETDAVIVGAGPVGLFQVFQLGLQDIRAHVVDALPRPGGQPVELYPDKPIYDIPGIPVCTGQELADALLRQIAPFQTTFHLGQTVAGLERQPDGRLRVRTSRGQQFLTRTLFIAAGVGAFEPRTLKIEGLARYHGTQVVHHGSELRPQPTQHLVIVGGGEDAVQAAVHFAEPGMQRVASVTLVHRRDVFQAAPEALVRLRALRDRGHLHLAIGQVIGLEERDGRLKALTLAGADDSTRVLPADQVLVLQGLSPRLGPIADWGLDMQRKQLVVDTEKFSTSVPGIFAVGDINTYPGKKKLILSGFHECALAAFGAAPIIFPEKGKIHLQYTTTSPKLHKVLGVESPVFD